MYSLSPVVYHFFENDNQIYTNEIHGQFHLKKGDEIFIRNSNYVIERIILKPTSKQKNVCVILKSGQELPDKIKNQLQRII
jgi:hypothetical protein